MVNPFDDRVAKYILGSQPYPRTEIPKTVQQNGVWDLTEASQRDTLYQWKMVTLECCCTTAKRMGSSNWGAVNLCWARGVRRLVKCGSVNILRRH